MYLYAVTIIAIIVMIRWAQNRRAAAFCRWYSAAQMRTAETALRARVTAAGEEAGKQAKLRLVSTRNLEYSLF